jgi:hypothetical protein
MATSFSGGRSRITRREPPTMGKQLVNFITCSLPDEGYSLYVLFNKLMFICMKLSKFVILVPIQNTLWLLESICLIFWNLTTKAAFLDFI